MRITVHNMAKRAAPSASTSAPAKKKVKRASSSSSAGEGSSDVLGQGKWKDWPAPMEQLQAAREFIKEW
jgi:hypothetical protein